MLNTKYNPTKGTKDIAILDIIKLGKINLNPGRTIITLNKKYKKFAPKVAIPTPTSPIREYGLVALMLLIILMKKTNSQAKR